MTIMNAIEPDVVEIDRNAVWHHLTQHQAFEMVDPLVAVEGKGLIITDAKGREFLDATSGGVWSVNIGYGRESMGRVVGEQLTKMCFFAGTGGTVPGALFAEKLLDKMPGMGRVYYSNSGSEANEKAYKMVRQLAHLKGDGRKHKVIYRHRDYHGTTIAALSSTGQEQRRADYGPFVDGFVEFANCDRYRTSFVGGEEEFAEFSANDLERVILQEGPDTVGSVILEPITAGGGVIVPPKGYFERIQEICRQYDVLLHMDEVVCAFGRTGKWFGYEHFGVKPDIVTMAKGVASGYAAISCTVTTEDIFNGFKSDNQDPLGYFRDISTFGGCAGGHAAALENIRIIQEEKLVDNARVIGAYFKDKLFELAEKHEVIGDVRGLGLLLGLELVKDRNTREPLDEAEIVRFQGLCMAHDLMIGRTNRSFNKLNNTICLTPALIAAKSDIDEIVSRLDQAFGLLAA
ncbi:aspartate aminotransferase family protein [Kordiimonas sp. SCSIO 12610]|uniref:aminotransferase family protein n=1 Tax=Kordiimonas sp. SCSIO 12610 TaxID=2829597 RepID=UPI00210DBB44|nr:aminotransferase class III-fold pyridoxal phosphate-dependent enzyme [Kordiimonas sp. SCSIO 12610]UTW54628.1 aminotransferase class III-fold pyridoxal phosphate-dependent enzyme [Kordiimonas sp. SCSIO 12610]